MKKIVYVTGCLGFIGSYITEKCLKNGWYVTGVDKITYAARKELIHQFQSEYKDQFRFIHSDINNLDKLDECDYVINTAAETHVDNSIVSSSEFLSSNINGVHRLLEIIRSKSIFKMPTLLHFSCYDEKTKALTKNGLKPYDQIKIGDEVISINPITGNMEFKKILNIIIQNYDGEMLHFKHKSDDLMVTPNHRMYFNYKNQICVDEARNICNNPNQLYLRGTKPGNNSEIITLPQIGMVSSKDLFYLSGIFIGDGFNAYQRKIVKNKSGFKRNEFLKLCRDTNGKFKTKNIHGPHEHTECNSYRIFFDVPVKDKARKKLETTLTNLNIKWYSEIGKSGEHIYFSSKAWMEYFEQFGKCAENKTIPEWMFEYDHSILRELYNGIIDSDGYYNKSGTGILTTTSYELVQKCCLLGYCLGFYMKFASYKQPEIPPTFKSERKIKSRKKSYQIFFNTKNIKCGNGKYKIKQYKGKIWCLTIEDNKNFVVERNGLLKISGNTDEVYGDVTGGTHTETNLLKPSNPYASTKAAADMLILAWARTFKVPYLIVRPTNNYGIGQYVEKLIPKVCKSVLLGRKVPLHNNGTPRRVWLHAGDTASAIVKLINSEIKNEIYNISGTYETTNIEIVTKIVKIITGDTDPTSYCDFSYVREGQDVRYSLNDSKLRSLGWDNVYELDNELPSIVQYYRDKFMW
jgi:dTDP-D-glucose 4,6-dehydratase